MKRAIFFGVLIAGLAWSSVSAYGVSATTSVNGKTNGPVTIAAKGTASTKGTTNYDSWIGPLPWPTYGCFLQSIPYLPFYRPTITGGTLPIITPSVNTNEVTGKTGWNYRYKVNVLGNASASLNTSAVNEFASGSTVYYVTSGSGRTDCDSGGTLGYISNGVIQVITK